VADRLRVARRGVNLGMCFSNTCGVPINLRRMERAISMIMMEIRTRWHEWLSGTQQTEERAMTISMHASLTAIGRQLKASYCPTLAKPLPSKLEDLLAQLAALEAGK
jgi:hypothetical protein